MKSEPKPSSIQTHVVPHSMEQQSKPRVKRVVCTSPERAYYRQASQDAPNKSANRISFTGRSLCGLFLCLGILATRKRVKIFLETDLVCRNIFLQLIFDVFLYRFFIAANRIHVISSAPKMSVSVFVLELGVPIKYHQTAFPF